MHSNMGLHLEISLGTFVIRAQLQSHHLTICTLIYGKKHLPISAGAPAQEPVGKTWSLPIFSCLWPAHQSSWISVPDIWDIVFRPSVKRENVRDTENLDICSTEIPFHTSHSILSMERSIDHLSRKKDILSLVDFCSDKRREWALDVLWTFVCLFLNQTISMFSEVFSDLQMVRMN